MKGSNSATMPPKLSVKSQHSGEQKVSMPSKDSGVANSALSAAGMSSRVSRRVDLSPEHLQPLPDDIEVIPASNVFHLKLKVNEASHWHIVFEAAQTRWQCLLDQPARLREMHGRSGLAQCLLREGRLEPS